MKIEHYADCIDREANWYYCYMDSHWFPANSKRPVNWCYEDRAPGRRSNPLDSNDCACETRNEQAYELAMSMRSERY